jgi:hypothetical protein
MRHLQHLGILLTGLLVAGLAAAVPLAAQGPPMRVFGAARLSGVPVALGTVVQATVGTTVCGSGVAGAGGSYTLDVAASPAGPCVADALLAFTVGGLPARESIPLQPGAFVALDLEAVAAAQGGPPMRVFGSARLGGLPAPPGTVIQAVVGASRCGSGTVGLDGRFVLDVATSPAGSCAAVPGVLVAFTVGGLPARETVAFEPGAFVDLNLSALNRPELLGEFVPSEPPATARR